MTAGLDQLVAHLADPNPASFVDPARRQLIQQILRQQIERKLVFQDFLRGVQKEVLPKIEQSVNREFEQSELPKLLKQERPIAQDLEWTLRSHGTSLERQRQMFLEEVVYEQWINEKVKTPEARKTTDSTMSPTRSCCVAGVYPLLGFAEARYWR